ncbi:MAG TPA: T9SS type A sorting domain-containing protein, partial [Cytophaga sp.]|nr:T9SS type A sorting domain-containing protein [Cytophaga sp.]
YFDNNAVLQTIAESDPWTITIIPSPLNAIYNNTICCDQSSLTFPINPTLLDQLSGTYVTTEDLATIVSCQWQFASQATNTWTDITGATQRSYDPPSINQNTRYRRVLTSSSGRVSASNEILISTNSCKRPSDQINAICSDQVFFNVKHGDIITLNKILGSYITPDIKRREFGFDYSGSTDEQLTWHNLKPKIILDITESILSGPGAGSCDIQPTTGLTRQCIIDNNFLDYLPPAITFDINNGPVQTLYIRRDYYHWYDEFNCSIFNFPPLSCGAQWHLINSSNVIKITLSSFGLPKPIIGDITSDKNSVTCLWSDQTITFNAPQVNNGETYDWEIPDGWTSYTTLHGPYANSITVSSNSGDKNYVIGGNVCVTITQPGQTNRLCKAMPGSSPTTIDLPAMIRGCEGETVVITPVLRQNNTIMNPVDYEFSWSAYQSQNINCGNPALNNCKQLSLTVSNVQQNPTQTISLRIRDQHGCLTSASTTLSTSPGWQMGILHDFSDPVAKSTSTLSLDEANNFLYFVANNGSIYRTYFDNTLQQWQYVELKDKTSNAAIKSDGAVAIYKGTTSKLFYVFGNTLFCAESTDNAQTWTSNSSNPLILNVEARIKVDGNNIYYINTIGNSRQVYYKPIININANTSATLVGNIGMNYSSGMFTVEDGILVYADQSGNIVAFNAVTGTSYTINVSAAIKQVMYNSTISIYAGNIYYANASGPLIILKRNTTTGVYDNSEQVPGLQLAGPFAINKQTGTIYAKTYDVAGKQIYYLNEIWNTAPIQNYTSATPIQSGMVYGNGHAFYIGTTGLLSNTFYIAPCTPAVLRAAGNNYDQTGDVLNDPLSNEISEDHKMLIYPNPTNSQIKATFTIPETSTVRIQIIPVTGGTSDVLSNTTLESGTQEVSLDLSNYSSGVYLIQLYVNESLYTTSKVVKF